MKDSLYYISLENLTRNIRHHSALPGLSNEPRRAGPDDYLKMENGLFVTTLEIIKGKWRFPILSRLFEGKKHFTELERELAPISTRMLSRDLKLFEKQGLVKRVVHPTVPPTVEYNLTKIGRSIKPILISMINWGRYYAMKP